MLPFEEDPNPSLIGRGIVDPLNAPSRITAPMVRESWLQDGPDANPHLRSKEGFVEDTGSRNIKPGEGPAAHTCLVEIERFNGEPPSLKAFDPPVIKHRS